jgi:peptide/nickel transport system substrate-binding protein
MNFQHTATASSPSRHWLLFLILAATLVVAACDRISTPATETPTTDPTATPVDPDEEPQTGGSLVVALFHEPDSLNFSLTSQHSALWILSTVDARMIRVRNDHSLEPILLREVPTLENGGISDDGLTYTIRFLPDLTWSDGDALDATDFVFTWETMVNPAYPAVHLRGWSLIEDVTVSADLLSAVIRLRSPSAEFVTRILAGGSGDSSGFLLPAHILGDTPPEEIPGHAYSAGEHIGAGPFRLVSWEPGEQIIVERNEDYWGEQSAYLDRIVFRFLPTPRDAIAQVTIGEVDLAVTLPETALLDAIQSEETVHFITPRAASVKTYAFNLNDPDDLSQPHPILHDPRVRRAITLGFDRASVVETILYGQTTVATSPLGNTVWAPDEFEPLPFDPEESARLLDDAGWTMGPDGYRTRAGQRLTLRVSTFAGDDPESALHQRVQEQFVSDMSELAIDVQVANYTIEEMIGDPDNPGILARRQFDIIDLPPSGGLPLDRLIERYSGTFIPTEANPYGDNVMGYDDEQVNRLLGNQALASDPDARTAMLVDVLERIREDAPTILIYNHIEIDVARSYVHGLSPGPAAGLWWNVEEWWISRDEVLSRKGATSG